MSAPLGCLTIVKWDDEFDSSPEFQFLQSWLLDQLVQVFGSAEFLHVSHQAFDGQRSVSTILAEAGERKNSDYVFILESPRILIGSQSLLRMKAKVDGARVGIICCPDSIHSFSEAVGVPLHTLCQYERLEDRLLSACEDHVFTVANSNSNSNSNSNPCASATSTPNPNPTQIPRTNSKTCHLPVSLMARDTFHRLSSELSVNTLLNDRNLLDRAGVDTICGGIYFQFGDYYGNVRDDVIAMLPARIDRVLEIGCGRGSTGHAIEQRFGCRVTGVELNPSIAKAAATKISKVIVGDVMTVDLEGPYDAVLACDIVEHLNYPEKLLMRLREIVSSDGVVLISIPNIGFWPIVESLLSGRWDYIPAGIQCYTHFRFYTLQSLESLFRRSGWSSFDVYPQTSEVPSHMKDLCEIPELSLDLSSLATSGFQVRLRK